MIVGVMILNYNGARWLPPLYDTIRRQTAGGIRVYLVDNASDDDSIEWTRQHYPEVTVLRMSANLGYSMAYNAAMPQALADGCDWLIWANNDILLEPDCIAELTRAAVDDERLAILGPAFLGWNDDEPNNYMRGAHPRAIAAMRRRQRTVFDVDWVEGSFLMVSRACLDDVGGLDPYLFFYWEEADFCRRARYRGWQVGLVPSAIARHFAGGSTKDDRDDRFHRMKTRNYYIFKLTDPARGLARNCFGALRLFAARLKAGLLRGEVPIWAECQVVVGLLGRAARIRHKWLRDRSGRRPPDFDGISEPVQVTVFGATGVWS